jgi:hypothetical protein
MTNFVWYFPDFPEEKTSSGRELRRTELAVAVVDRRHRHKIQLIKTIRKPVHLIEVCDTN